MYFYCIFCVKCLIMCFFLLTYSAISAIKYIFFLSFIKEVYMKHHYTFVLVHKELDRDNTYIQFRGSDYQAKKSYDVLSFSLNSSPYCKLLLLRGQSIVRQTLLKGAF